MRDLVFNELSIMPLVQNEQEAKERIEDLIQVFKIAKQKFDFSKITFVEELDKYELSTDQKNFLDCMQKQSRIIQDLFWGIKKYPFYDDDNEPQVNKYVENAFFIKNEKDEKNKCDGLGVAYLYDTPAISFASANTWDNIKIEIFIQDNENNEIQKNVFHISKPEHLESENELTQWLKENIQNSIQEIHDLKKLYPQYVFEQQAFDDLMYWKQQDKELYKKLHLLLKDIEMNPFVGGLGKTEPLKYKKGHSKRLNDEHRVQYDLGGANENKIITIFRCKEHYK